MPWLIEALFEAALSPWGVAVGAAAIGIGLVRRRAGDARAERLKLRDARPRLTPRLGLGGWWQDVCAEAQAEWDAERSRPAPAAKPAPGAPASVGRVRDHRGRFIKTASGK